MMKKLVVLLACLSFSMHMTGCTSNDTQKDSEAAVDLESADLEKLDGDEALEIASDDTVSEGSDAAAALGETETPPSSSESTDLDVADSGSSDALPADPFAEAPAADVAATDSFSSSESTPSTTDSDSTSMLESTTSTQTETTTTSTFPGSSDYSSSSSTSYVDDTPKANVPLQKVPTAPWKTGGVLYNTVYFARPGDSLSKISKKLYGSSGRVSELKKGNATFASRDVKPGDKVYYNSPHRPTDDARMITYYEDNGIAPEVYVAQSGDNIRDVANKILNYKGAWKELWASNSVDSKGELSAGTELRYWKDGMAAAAAPTQDLASSQMPAPPVPEQPHNDMPPPPTMAENDPSMVPPPPMPEDPMAQQQAQNDIPPPPPMPEAPPDMPPPPPAEAFNPPAPSHDMAMDEDSGGEMNNNSTMALGVVGIAAAGLAALVVMRKKRKQRELEQQAFDNTQVGT